MVIGDRGYVFTLLISMMIMITLSLTLFYGQISSPSFADKSNKISLDELHYFVESLKKDASRAVSISGQRSSAYLINHIIDKNETMTGYTMINCTDFNYSRPGAESAIAELMICGDLQNPGWNPENIDIFMENNTILDWIDLVSTNQTAGLPYNVTVEFKNMELVMYDSFNLVAFTEFDFKVVDRSSNNRYNGKNIPITSVIEITTLEDPMHYVMTDVDIPSANKFFSKCDTSGIINGSRIDDWIDNGCYISVSNDRDAPSFFDRLDGLTSLNTEHIDESIAKFKTYGYMPGDLSIASTVNLNLLSQHNSTVNENFSQIDASYWKRTGSICYIDGMERHKNFRIDIPMAFELGINGLNCHVYIDNITDSTYRFTPQNLVVPKDTSITFIERSGNSHTMTVLKIPPESFDLFANSRHTFTFEDIDDYIVECQDHSEFFTLKVTDSI